MIPILGINSFGKWSYIYIAVIMNTVMGIVNIISSVQRIIETMIFINFKIMALLFLTLFKNVVMLLIIWSFWMSCRDKPVLASNQYIVGLCRTLLTPKMAI